MKFKLDENFGKRTQQLFRMGGHDVQTVREEKLQGSPDQFIYDHCCREQRCLVTLDLDFADVTRFPPNQTAGMAVIRVPKNPTLPLLESLIRQFLSALNTTSVNQQLWIIEVGRIRVHQSEADEETGL
jgi:predicted nuclease of predicted toxin-antitoxin system